jgi:hypothetical protein
MNSSKTYRPNFFRHFVFDPTALIILVVMLIIIPLVGISTTSSELNKSFWEVFWTNPSDPEFSKTFPNPIIKNVPIGIEFLIIALVAWFLVMGLVYVLAVIFDKVILTNKFIRRGKLVVELSDIERINIGEAGVSAITKIYPAVPQPSELPQAVLRSGEIKIDLPGWLIKTKFFEDLKNRAPHIKVNVPQLKTYSLSKSLVILLVFVAIFLAFFGFFYWLAWIKNLPFSHLGSFNFAQFFQQYPFAEKVVIGGGGLVAIFIFLFLSLGLVFIYDRNWRKTFLKTLALFAGLHLLVYFLYYFGFLK